MVKFVALIVTLVLYEVRGIDFSVDLKCPDGWAASNLTSYKCSFPIDNSGNYMLNWKHQCFVCLTCLQNPSQIQNIVELCLFNETDVAGYLNQSLQIQHDKYLWTDTQSKKRCGVSLPFTTEHSSKENHLPCKEPQNEENNYNNVDLICPDSFPLNSTFTRTFAHNHITGNQHSCIKCQKNWNDDEKIAIVTICFLPKQAPSHVTYHYKTTDDCKSTGCPFRGAKFFFIEKPIEVTQCIQCQDGPKQQEPVSTSRPFILSALNDFVLLIISKNLT